MITLVFYNMYLDSSAAVSLTLKVRSEHAASNVPLASIAVTFTGADMLRHSLGLYEIQTFAELVRDKLIARGSRRELLQQIDASDSK